MQQWAHPFFSGGNALKAFRLMRHDHSSPLGADMLKPTLTWNNRTGRLPSPPRRLGGSGTFSANLSAMQGGKWVWTVWGTSLQVVTGELSLLFAAFFMQCVHHERWGPTGTFLHPVAGHSPQQFQDVSVQTVFQTGIRGCCHVVTSGPKKRSPEPPVPSWLCDYYWCYCYLSLSIAIYC